MVNGDDDGRNLRVARRLIVCGSTVYGQGVAEDLRRDLGRTVIEKRESQGVETTG